MEIDHRIKSEMVRLAILDDKCARCIKKNSCNDIVFRPEIKSGKAICKKFESDVVEEHEFFSESKIPIEHTFPLFIGNK